MDTNDSWDVAADQKRTAEWVTTRFGAEIQAYLPERVDRVLEEAIELHQSEHGSSDELLQNGWEHAHRIVDRVYGKDPGEPRQEMAGLTVTLLAYAEAKGYRIDEEAKRELERIESISADHFRTRQQKKAAEGIALAPSSTPVSGHKLPGIDT